MASCRCHKAVYTRGLAFEQPLESQVDVPTGRNQPLEAEKPLMADYVVPGDVPGPVLELVQQLEFGFCKEAFMYKVLVSFADS